MPLGSRRPTDSRFAPDTLSDDELDPTREPFRSWWTGKASEIQAAIDRDGLKWVAEENFLTRMSADERRRYLGLLVSGDEEPSTSEQ